MLIKRLILCGALATLAGCTLDETSAPALAGPSELGLTLDAAASPDILNQDGVSQSTLSVFARDANGQPARVTLRVDIRVDGAPVDFGTLAARSITTSQDGRGSVVYTAPPAPLPTVTDDTTIAIVFTPVGTNYASTVPRQVNLRLLRPGAISAPTTGVSPIFTIAPSSPKIGDAVVLDATQSSAGSRNILSYQWDFGDGDTGSGKVVSHVFTEAGTFAIRLTITDDIGRSATSSQTISLGTNLPTASFIISPSDPLVSEQVVFNGKPSTPGLGRGIVEYSWDFGDGATAFGATATHTYGVGRTYTVVLTVTDDLGQQSSTTNSITVKDLEASFTVSPSDATAPVDLSFNASGSKVPAGVTITSYKWDFGGGLAPTTATTGGPSTTHTYNAAGTFTVVLTIQDSLGHTATASQTVTVN